MNTPRAVGSLRLPDEDALVIPDAWRKHLHPRRDRPSAALLSEAAAKETVALTQALGEVAKSLTGSSSGPGRGEPELSERGLAYLRGTPDPLGAAVTGMMASIIADRSRGGGLDLVAVVDGWVAGNGLAFAACAFTEMVEIIAARETLRWIGYAHGSLPAYVAHPAARRLRALLAVADEGEYEEAVRRLDGCRRTPSQRLFVSYLVPTRLDWVDQCCRARPDDDNAVLLFCALGSAHQVGLLDPGWDLRWEINRPGVLATVVEGVGVAAAPLLAGMLKHKYVRAEGRRTLLDAIARLPSDEAFQILLDRLDDKYVQPAVQRAMKRFPVRALRLLAQAAEGASKKAGLAAGLMHAHLRANPKLVQAVLPDLPVNVRQIVESIHKRSAERIPDAPAEALPPLLTAPPWTRDRKTAEAVVMPGLAAPVEPVMRWAPGERDKWAKTRDLPRSPYEEADWRSWIERFRSGHTTPLGAVNLMEMGPLELVRPLLADWEPTSVGYLGWHLRGVVARFELDAFPVALRVARANPAGNGALLLPYLSAEVALLMAEWLVRLKRGRKLAVGWFERHGPDALALLLPVALGEPGATRGNAAEALRLLASTLGADEVVAAARGYGEQAAKAIAEVLAADPLDVVPPRMPTIGRWADPVLLPQLLLRGRAHALPAAATRHVIAMLSISRPGEVYPGVAMVRELCDPVSVSEFCWALFEAWRVSGAPSRDGWALHQLGWLGDDATVRRLAPLVRAWPGEVEQAKTIAGLEVLAAIGTDLALMHLHGLARTMRRPSLKAVAQEKVDRLAAERGLTPEQVADRVVPGFGLDADGSMVLDYGPRRFVVGFDEGLKPYVTDMSGKRRVSLPKPGVKDDPEPAHTAYQRFAGLRKDVRTAAAEQIRRMQAAMGTRRRWTTGEFEELFVRHPLLWHITRRLVWLAEDDGTTAAFRLAEDRTLADAADDALTPPDSARIGIAHPLDLGESLKAWSQVFADYEILQPFPQLGRPVYALTEQERARRYLDRFAGITVPVGRVMGLERHGWRRGEPQDAGIQGWISRQIAPDRYIVIDFSPGIAVGDIDFTPEQTIGHVELSDEPVASWWRPVDITFAELHPVTASELLATLTDLTARPPA